MHGVGAGDWIAVFGPKHFDNILALRHPDAEREPPKRGDDYVQRLVDGRSVSQVGQFVTTSIA